MSVRRANRTVGSVGSALWLDEMRNGGSLSYGSSSGLFSQWPFNTGDTSTTTTEESGDSAKRNSYIVWIIAGTVLLVLVVAILLIVFRKK